LFKVINIYTSNFHSRYACGAPAQNMAGATGEEIGQWAKFDVPKMKQLRPIYI